ncbi:MAG: adenine deaminase [Bacteroidales bacterium]|nr:adenine deaminase [Bacteroidales bacterium]
MKTNNEFQLQGRIVDLVNMEIYSGTLVVDGGKIQSICREPVDAEVYIMPGLIDAHVHIESSMLIPSEFARLAVVHGTVATVSDPHEIGNVLGVKGINYMIENGKKVPFKFFFGASSCVPATGFETAGATIGTDEIDALLQHPEIKYLSEMMNYPGVLFQDKEVMQKLAIARKYNKPVDGHAPGLMGKDVETYIKAGISTDHECFTMEEALEKIKYGMKIQIREGSAAKNFDALIGLLDDHADMVLFCSDDKHPNDLVEGHINAMVKRAIALGHDPLKVLRSCVLNPVEHYRLEVGLLRAGDPADLIVVDDLNSFQVLKTFVDGVLVAENGQTLIRSVEAETPNAFVAAKVRAGQLAVKSNGSMIRVIEALEGQLITQTLVLEPGLSEGKMVSDTGRDILKMVVYNRYQPSAPAIGFIRNFGLKHGAMASTVAHDSHNVIAVGVSDQDIADAMNMLVESKGGISVTGPGIRQVLPLPVAGLMSNGDGYTVASAYEHIDQLVKSLGSQLHAPFMTLSFMALLVIPQLKLSDKGLFDGKTFAFTSLEV